AVLVGHRQPVEDPGPTQGGRRVAPGQAEVLVADGDPAANGLLVDELEDDLAVEDLGHERAVEAVLAGAGDLALALDLVQVGGIAPYGRQLGVEVSLA